MNNQQFLSPHRHNSAYDDNRPVQPFRMITHTPEVEQAIFEQRQPDLSQATLPPHNTEKNPTESGANASIR